MKINALLFLCLIALSSGSLAQTSITIDLSAEKHVVSRYLYGRNNSLSDNPSSPLTSSDWKKIKDAGVTFFRESGGNNSTKYNWRRKLGSHPDWYNNVYPHDWDFMVKSLQQNIPSAQGMWSFQLIGKAAKTTTANFNDWDFNQAKYWEGVAQNLAGGGVMKSSGTKALQEGNPLLYLENWTADSTVGILNHWLGPNGLGINKNKVLYWNMDNESEIWSGTHDDIMPTQIAAENFMQQYFDVAKKARAVFPEIKLVGPVTANEWQWYNWNGSTINVNGVSYPWLKFFIKRVAEEQQATGKRLLDVLDIHFYPGSTKVSDVVQYHRVFFDRDYVFPEANGVKNINGSWNNAQNKEYILERCREWLVEYMGADHGVTFGVTEIGTPEIGANGIAVWYASTLGEFMRHPEMEIFTPWTWQEGMWEVLHLFSRYNKSVYVKATSTNEELVSAYPTLNAIGDSLTVVLVNRSTSGSTNVNLNFKGFNLNSQDFNVLKLNNLGSTETFFTHQTNALQKSTIQKTNNNITISLPSLSIVTLQLKGAQEAVVTDVTEERNVDSVMDVFPNPSSDRSMIKVQINRTGQGNIEVVNEQGKTVRKIFEGKIESVPFIKEVNNQFGSGVYFIRLKLDGKTITKKIVP